MARGDYVRIVYRTGTGVAEERVDATLIGGGVEVDVPQAKAGRPADNPFVEVRETNKVNDSVRTYRFATADVVALIEGHQNGPARKKAAK